MPKRVVTEQWIAFDGVPHPTEAACRAYQIRLAHVHVTKLTIEQVEAALSREDLDLADAFEEVARRIKRVRNAKPGDPAPPTNGDPADGGDETQTERAA